MASVMKLKKLEEYLQGVEAFENPKILLEQYITPPHIASCMLHAIQTKYGDLDGMLVADLGCGSGMLSIGALLLGAQHVVGFELDPDAIVVMHSNLDDLGIEGQIDVIQCDVSTDVAALRVAKQFDTVVMNPPFGTKKNAGLDVKFLEAGVQMARKAVYSLHKSSTWEYIKKRGIDLGTCPEIVAKLRYNINASYKFHKKQSVDIEVDLWRFTIK